MKLVKRGLLTLFVFLILSSLVYADALNVNLSSTKVGPKNNFDGYLIFNYTGFRSLETPLVFHSGSSSYNVSLERLFNITNLVDNPNLIILEATYQNSTSTKDSEVVVNFQSNGSKVGVGLDLRGRNRQAADVNVQSIGFTIGPSGSPQPSDVSIFLGEQRVFRYRGSATGWASLDRNYLGDFSADGSQNMVGDNVFCQLVNLTDSNEYKVNVSVKQIGGIGSAGLNATIV